MRSLSRPLAVGLLLAVLAALFVVLPAVAAGSAPTITLGRFDDLYMKARPLLTVLFVVVGLVMVVMRLWSSLTGMRTMQVGPGMSAGAKIGDLAMALLGILLLTGIAIFLIWNWVELVNGIISILWSISSDVESVSVAMSAHAFRS